MNKTSRPSTEASFSILLTAVTACVALAAPACGGAAQSTNFPTRAELAQLAAAPPPAHVFEKGALDVDKWAPTGPFPDAVDSSPTDDASPWTKALLGAAAASPAAWRCPAGWPVWAVRSRRSRPRRRRSRRPR